MIGVVGGSGFVGSSVIKLLRDNGIDVKCFDLQTTHLDVPYVYYDVTERNCNQKFSQVSSLINLAAVHRDDVRPLSLYSDVNVLGAEHICAAATEMGINQIVFTSSVAIYGFAKPDTGEDGEINYFNEYGRTKYLAEKVYLDWYNTDPENRSLVIVRPTVIFGPGNRGNVFNLLKQIASRNFIMFGSGENIKSMAYVENVAKFLVYSLDFGPGVHIYNYVDKPDMNMNKLVSIARGTLFSRDNVGLRLPAFLGVAIGLGFDLLASITQRSFSVSSIRVKKFMATTQFRSSVSQTDFEPELSLEEGLSKTLRYEFLDDNSEQPTFETE